MTQPPDERDPLADRTPETDATADQPTIAWSPGGSPSVPTPTEPPPAAEPPAAPPAWPSAPPPSDASMPPAAVPPPADQPLASPASPIISASPSGVPPEPTGWQQPGVAGPAGPVVGWETPAAAAASAPGSAGYVISGMGARIVAYFLDGLIVTIVPIILSLLVIDWGAMFRQGLDASVVSNTGRTTFTMEVTPQLILVTLIGLAIQFIYFVGFWTSGGQATPGMRLLKMKVVDAATGGVLSLSAATKRFIALGAPLALLSLVPIASIQSLGGLAQFALLLFLFFTAITNDRRQGLHDKWANSLVIRSATSGDGATLVGCLLLVVILGVIGIVAGGIFFAAVGPDLEEYMRRAMESAQPVAP
ncbi:MAG TPA: RDD family protein [Methylomirabilota bacterium]|nr:RDD family protein [Methylomirabilota bacterium]